MNRRSNGFVEGISTTNIVYPSASTRALGRARVTLTKVIVSLACRNPCRQPRPEETESKPHRHLGRADPDPSLLAGPYFYTCHAVPMLREHIIKLGIGKKVSDTSATSKHPPTNCRSRCFSPSLSFPRRPSRAESYARCYQGGSMLPMLGCTSPPRTPRLCLTIVSAILCWRPPADRLQLLKLPWRDRRKPVRIIGTSDTFLPT